MQKSPSKNVVALLHTLKNKREFDKKSMFIIIKLKVSSGLLKKLKMFVESERKQIRKV